MNTDNLKQGMTFKNYREICRAIDEPIKAGKGKSIQLEEWLRYFSYEKISTSFIIHEVYDEVKKKIDKRIIWSADITNDIIYRLQLYEGQPFNMNSRNMMLEYGMVNDNHSAIKLGKGFKLYNNLTSDERVFYMKEYHEVIYRKLKRILNNGFNYAQKEELLTWERKFLITFDGDTHIASDEEVKLITSLQKKILSTYKVHGINQLNKSGKQKYFNDLNKIYSLNGIKSVSKTNQFYPTDYDYSDYESCIINKDDFNKRIIDALNVTIDKRTKNNPDFPKNYNFIMKEMILFMNKI